MDAFGIRRIWEHLADEESKEIFILRYMYLMTGDNYFLRKTALTLRECREIYSILKMSEKKKLIFGAGVWGAGIISTYDDIEFECFVDNYRDKKNITEYMGKRVLSFAEYLAEYKDELIIISSRVYNQQIYRQLIENGIKKEDIINIGETNDYLNTKQYFDLPQLKEKVCEKEIFIDGGCLDGRSSICFKEWCGERFGKIIAFEPDIYNGNLCKTNFAQSGITDYRIVNKGLWNEKNILGFEENKNGLSKVVNSGGSVNIEVDCLDHMVDEKVTFIKMDVEGAEYNALLGSKEIIRKQVPKLAISIYHKPEDIIEIPLLILSFNDDYSLYLRHYSTSWNETILYAI